MPIEEILVGPEEKGAGPTRRIENLDLGSPSYILALQEFADGLVDDVVDHVRGSIVDAPCFFDLRLLLDPGLMARRQTNDLSKKLFVNLSKDIRGQYGELVGAVRVIEAADDPLENPVVHLKTQRDLVGRLFTLDVRVEMEQPRVVALIGFLEEYA